MRQLRDAPDALVIEAYAKNSRNGLAASLAAVREDSSLLLGPDKKEPVRFTLVARSELGVNRRAGKRPGFVQSVIAATESFYGDMLQHLTTYQIAAPKMQPRPEATIEAAVEELPSIPLVVVSEAESTTEPQVDLIVAPPPAMSWMVNR